MATLYIVATPIGNLEDISTRLRRILSEAPVVAAESLTRTRKLLSHLGLKRKRLISCREANRKLASQKLAEALDKGQDVALVSDAGTPGISDPGGWVVQAIAQTGHRICPIAGPSAWAAGLSVSGLSSVPSLFLGFLPAKAGPRRRLLSKAGKTGWTIVLFAAPHRLGQTARDLLEILGDRPLVVGRELTKINEEILYTTTSLFCETLSERVRGELTIIVDGQPVEGSPGSKEFSPEENDGLARMEDLLNQGLLQGKESPSRLAKRVAKETGVPREEVYRCL